jgi:hypothetical protein
MMKTSLLLCGVVFLAASANAQCAVASGKIGAPLRVLLLMKSDVPNAVQSAFQNALRAIPDIEVRSGSGAENDLVIGVIGTEIKANDGIVMGFIWHWEAFRGWRCGPPVPILEEKFDAGLSVIPSSELEAVVKSDVAKINAKTLEKLRQERDASQPK